MDPAAMTQPEAMTPPETTRPDAVERVHRFVTAIRNAGMPVPTERIETLLAALAELGPPGLYWAGRLTLCSGPQDVEIYDSVYRGLLEEPRPAPVRRFMPPVRSRAAVTFGLDAGTRPGGDPEAGADISVAARASADEVLRHRDLALLSDAERQEVRRLLALLTPAAPLRRSRRMRPARTGPVDTRRTVRGMLAGLGEPARLRRRDRGRRPRPLVILLDISGSMALYADALLRLAHAAVRARPQHTEVFTVGTRLTRITPSLRLRDPEAALTAAGRSMPDWRGGTRLGAAILAYLREFGHRGAARGAVVVVCSDGWECGDPADLGAAMAWLARLAERVVWVTPHAGRDGFAPTAGGLAAALPHVRHLVAGHSVDALADLMNVLGGRR
jgi:uncharacterized protein with von Willebrand factor type A (vWA) domain